MSRKGEKIGWVGGWLGGFSWVLGFGVVWLMQGRITYGIIALLLFMLAVCSIFKFAPWEKPEAKYWKLLLPVYSFFLLSVMFVIYALTGFNHLERIQYGLWIFPCLAPLFILGGKTWNDKGGNSNIKTT